MKKILVLVFSLIFLCMGLFGGCDKKADVDVKNPSKVIDDSSNKSGLKEDARDKDTVKDTKEDINKEKEIFDDLDADDVLDDFFIERSEFTQRFANYSCEIIMEDSVGEKYSMKYKIHPDGVRYDMDRNGSSIIIYDNKNRKLYMLYEDKTGMVMDITDGESYNPVDYLTAWSNLAPEPGTLEKGGSDTVDGRKATKYYYKSEPFEVNFYVDDEYGFCLFYEFFGNNELVTRWEVKDFKTDSVSAGDIAVPPGYEIIDLEDLEDTWD